MNIRNSRCTIHIHKNLLHKQVNRRVIKSEANLPLFFFLEETNNQKRKVNNSIVHLQIPNSSKKQHSTFTDFEHQEELLDKLDILT